MTRQALAELSALLAQRAVMASPSQVAKDALKLARYARAAASNKQRADLGEISRRDYQSKADSLSAWAACVAAAYLAKVFPAPFGFSGRSLLIQPLPNTPPIQGYPEGYAI